MISKIQNIHITYNILTDIGSIQNLISDKNFLIVTDETVAKLHLTKLISALPALSEQVLILPTGEENKSLGIVERILQRLHALGYDRGATIISLGGGVVGDLVGLAASLYMRGIKWLQIPTTLLAQVDAAIGGKTGCNYLGIKNLIGTFYFPKQIWIDLYFLHTLSMRQYTNGLAEVVKYAIACDADFFVWLEQHKQLILQRDKKVLQEIVEKCCKLKLAIVDADPLDLDSRMVLNFGHTFAHAIEAATEYKVYLHGEAVALGMLLATQWAVKLGLIDKNILNRLKDLLIFFGLPTKFEQQLCDKKMLSNYISHDKKRLNGIYKFILPTALGAVKCVEMITLDNLEEIL